MDISCVIAIYGPFVVESRARWIECRTLLTEYRLLLLEYMALFTGDTIEGTFDGI